MFFSKRQRSLQMNATYECVVWVCYYFALSWCHLQFAQLIVCFCIYVDWQQRQQSMCTVRNSFILCEKWTNEIFREKNVRVYINFFACYCFHPFVELFLIIIQDQVYWRKLRCDVRKKLTPFRWKSRKTEKIVLLRITTATFDQTYQLSVLVCLCLVFLQMIYS